MFYRLVSDQILSNTFKEYKGLIQALGMARSKDPGENGYISPFAFSDDSRYIEDIDDVFVSQQDYVENRIDNLRSAGETYFEAGCLPAWYRQPNYVEVMIEKEALRGAFKSVLPPNYVRIVPNKGWDSIPNRNNNIRRLYNWRLGKNTNDILKKVYVLYFGDYDPTGITMYV